jgi:hypothetical protein
VIYRPSGSFDCADHDEAVICFAQDDRIIGCKDGIAVTGLWRWLLGVHLFLGGDELPAPGFGEVFEVWVLGAD